MVERFPDALVDGVPEGRVPMGATAGPFWPGLEPGARSRGGEAPVGLEVLVRLWEPTALSKALLVGPELWGLLVLWGLGLGSPALWSLTEPGVTTSAPDGTRPIASKARGEGPRMLDGPLCPGTPWRMLPDSST